MTDFVSTNVTFGTSDGSGCRGSLRANLSWTTDEPLAVHVQFFNDYGISPHWVWTRELLTRGCLYPSTDGDMQVLLGKDNPARVYIGLRNDFTLSIGLVELGEFLLSTYALDGTREKSGPELDDEIRALLEGAA